MIAQSYSPLDERFSAMTLRSPQADIRPIVESIIPSIPLNKTAVAYGKSDHVYLAIGSSKSIRFENGFIFYSSENESRCEHVGSNCWTALSSFIADAQSDRAPVFGYVGHDALESDAPGNIPAFYMFIPESVLEITNRTGMEISEWIWGSDQFSGQLAMSFSDTCWKKPHLRSEDIKFVEDRLTQALNWVNEDEERQEGRAATVSGQFCLEDFTLPLDMVFSAPIALHAAYRSFYGRFPGISLEFTGHCPETLIHTESGLLTSFKLSGTWPIGDSEEESIAQIKANPKLIAEHEGSIAGYLSLLQNLGEVHRAERDILPLRSLLHFVSRIDTKMNPSIDPVEVIKTALPPGTRPRSNGLKIIREIESEPRGPYYGLVGMITPDGEMDFTQILRTVFKFNSKTYIQAGANVSGATAQYWPIHLEAEEVSHKASSVLLPENFDQASSPVRKYNAPVDLHLNEIIGIANCLDEMQRSGTSLVSEQIMTSVRIVKSWTNLLRKHGDNFEDTLFFLIDELLLLSAKCKADGSREAMHVGNEFERLLHSVMNSCDTRPILMSQ